MILSAFLRNRIKGIERVVSERQTL